MSNKDNKKKKSFFKSGFFWSAILAIFSLANYKENPDAMYGGLLCAAIVLIVTLLRRRKAKKNQPAQPTQVYQPPIQQREPQAPTPQPTPQPKPTESPQPIYVVTSHDAPDSIHAVERFHKLKPTEFIGISQRDGYVVFDFETTGLGRKMHRICEIGAIKYDVNGDEIDRFETLVNPEQSIPESATKVNGITYEMVMNAPTIKEVLPDFLSFIDGCPIIAYNAEFDIGFLKTAVDLCNLNCAVQYADAMAWAKLKYTLTSYKQANVAKHIGIVPSNAHRSMGDCETLSSIVKELMKA